MKRSTLMTQNSIQKSCEIVVFCVSEKRILFLIFQLLFLSVFWITLCFFHLTAVLFSAYNGSTTISTFVL